jgi:cytochrome-b5 reductase
MLAGGTGITPFLQIIREVLKHPEDNTQLSLVFANIAKEDILLKEELDHLAAAHPNFKVYYVLEKPPKDWQQGVGFINENIIKKTMPPPNEDNLVLVTFPAKILNLQ